MAVQLNHTVVHSHDKKESAEFLARILGIGPPGAFGHFVTVEVANGVSLDFDTPKRSRPALRLPRRGRGVRSDLRAREEEGSCTTRPEARAPGEINTTTRTRLLLQRPGGSQPRGDTRPYGTVEPFLQLDGHRSFVAGPVTRDKAQQTRIQAGRRPMPEEAPHHEHDWLSERYVEEWIVGDAKRPRSGDRSYAAPLPYCFDRDRAIRFVDLGAAPGTRRPVLEIPELHSGAPRLLPPMINAARKRLAGFGERVDYRSPT